MTADKSCQARKAWAVTGYAIAAVCLVWVFHDTDWRELGRSIVGIDWRWVAAGVLLDLASYVWHGFRWHLLLRPLGRISTVRTTQAVYSGLFINEVLPMRVGEVARAYLVSRWMSRDIVAVIPSMALERLFEGVWLAVGIGVTAIFVPLPKNLARAGDIFGATILVLVAAAVLLVTRKKRTEEGDGAATGGRPHGKLYRWLASFFARLGEGFRSIGMSRDFGLAFVSSFFLLAFQALGFWAIMRACGLDVKFWVGAAVFLIVAFGTALPNAPANVGTYQFFCVVGLTLFGVAKTAAAGFSVVVFILLTIPLWAVGFFALGRSGMTLASIRAEIRDLKESR